jgi:hypothetical protein
MDRLNAGIEHKVRGFRRAAPQSTIRQAKSSITKANPTILLLDHPHRSFAKHEQKLVPLALIMASPHKWEPPENLRRFSGSF